MNCKKYIPLGLFWLSVLPGISQTEKALYKDSTQPVEARVQDLLKRMTLEEKFWQMFMIPGGLQEGKDKYKNGIFGFQVNTEAQAGGAAAQLMMYGSSGSAVQMAKEINDMQRFFTTETRLGIPIIPFDEALHGLVRAQATAYPQAIGLAATWDTALMHQVANAIALESKSRGIRQILTPVVNIAADVRWGRTEETYGEDPFLTSEMGVAFVSAFEKLGIVSTPKHFIANVGDGGRDSYPIHYNERLLNEIYFPPFRACFERGGSRSVMTAYNSVDGSPATANNHLLNTILKHDWNFKGFVISDASAVGGANVLHYTATGYDDATASAVNNGLDVIFQTSYQHYPLFKAAFDKGYIRASAIDSAVARVLRVKFELGLFENPYIHAEDANRYVNNAQHRSIARQASKESIVLLKNDRQVLPFSKKLTSLAVIGEDAMAARLGGYSGPGEQTVNIVTGIKRKVPGMEVTYAPGPGRFDNNYVVVPADCFFYKENGQTKKGLQACYYDNVTATGTPKVSRVDETVNFQWTLFAPDRSLHYDFFSAEWNGFIQSPVSGTVQLGIQGNDGYRLYINDVLLIDTWDKSSFDTLLKPVVLVKDKAYKIKLVYHEPNGSARLKLVWDAGVKHNNHQLIQQAVAAVQKAGAAVVVVGIEEGEFRDRAKLSLPGQQEALIQAIAATGKPFAVVIVGGSAVTMNSWIHQTPAILDVWYPGDEGGNAIADVLFGDYNPAGRLPVTFPVFEGQLPLVYNHKPTGRGDDYDNLTGQPLFPFGHGLSYTRFTYSDLRFDKSEIKASDSVNVFFTIKNTGDMAGDEVVQLYIHDEIASIVRPVKELKGFQRILLQPGEQKEVHFTITPEMLTMYNADMQQVIEPGAFRVMIGGSSKTIQLRDLIQVK
ncbi:glycoside hydrolase family 3 N-terminal domain-containing protein [Filimonas lacunae]|nr:glycoside hydrolase family 3 N-terminal domain-containing protein [Filimonas lacunae]BAV08791.1 beta-glucosidase [Filimonas lacunae]